MLRTLTVVVLVASTLLGGCHVDSREQVVMRHSPRDEPDTRRAPYDGQYRLYAGAARRPTTRTATPILDRTLCKGDRIGFDRDQTGQLMAVCRADRHPLGAAGPGGGSYTWTMQPRPDQIDAGKTVLLVAAIVVGVGVAVAVSLADARPTFVLPPIYRGR